MAVWAGVGEVKKRFRCIMDFGMIIEAESEEEAYKSFSELIINLIKYPFFEYAPRYSASTGESLLDGYKRLGKWAIYLYFFLTFSTMFALQAAVTIVTAGLFSSVFPNSFDIIQWSFGLLLISATIVIVGRYSLLDSLIKVIIIILTLATLIAVVSSVSKGFNPNPDFVNSFDWEFADIAFLIAFVYLAKGIEREHNIFPYDILKKYFGENSVSVMSGPSFADEVAAGKPTVLVIASKNNNFAKKIQHMFSNESLRIYTSDDPIGVSLGGALKNIIAIAAGICDGMELGHNARAALITRGLSEIVRLGNAMNVDIKTLFGIAGVGDLILTCTSKKSRNYIFGLRIGKGEKTEDIIASMKQVAEGIYSTYGALYLAKKFNIEMPITKTVHQIIWNGKSPKQGVIELMTRPLKSEW